MKPCGCFEEYRPNRCLRYKPNVAQGKDAADMLRILYALVPCLCNAVSILIMCFFPITEKVHAQILEKIEINKHQDRK